MKAISLYRPLPDGIGSVSQLFGEHPSWYKPMGFAGHNGIDYSCPIGTSILATHSGRIITAKLDDPIKFNGGYGYYIRIEDEGYNTIYAHLSEIFVKEGDIVTPNQIIGLSGNTGNSTGPHVHYGLRLLGVNVDPSTTMYDPMQGYVNPALFRDVER